MYPSYVLLIMRGCIVVPSQTAVIGNLPCSDSQDRSSPPRMGLPLANQPESR
jgi:hypothetical protein